MVFLFALNTLEAYTPNTSNLFILASWRAFLYHVCTNVYNVYDILYIRTDKAFQFNIWYLAYKIVYIATVIYLISSMCWTCYRYISELSMNSIKVGSVIITKQLHRIYIMNSVEIYSATISLVNIMPYPHIAFKLPRYLLDKSAKTGRPHASAAITASDDDIWSWSARVSVGSAMIKFWSNAFHIAASVNLNLTCLSRN